MYVRREHKPRRHFECRHRIGCCHLTKERRTRGREEFQNVSVLRMSHLRDVRTYVRTYVRTLSSMSCNMFCIANVFHSHRIHPRADLTTNAFATVPYLSLPHCIVCPRKPHDIKTLHVNLICNVRISSGQGVLVHFAHLVHLPRCARGYL